MVVLDKCARGVNDCGRCVPGCQPHRDAIERAAREAAIHDD
jgi:hypothetical protein